MVQSRRMMLLQEQLVCERITDLLENSVLCLLKDLQMPQGNGGLQRGRILK